MKKKNETHQKTKIKYKKNPMKLYNIVYGI